MTNLESILKSKDITLPTKVHLVKARESPKKIYFCFIDYIKAFESVGQKKIWKIIKVMDLTCPLENLYAGQEAIVRTRHGIMDWF